MRTLLLALLLLPACCPEGRGPRWTLPERVELHRDSGSYELSAWVEGGRGALEYEVESGSDGLIAWTEGSVLELAAQPGWKGATSLDLLVTDACGRSDRAELQAVVGPGGAAGGEDYFSDPCAVTFTYRARGNPERVLVVGAWDGWAEHEMESLGGGTWRAVLDRETVPEGAWAYDFVEVEAGIEHRSCDPEGPLILCDEGYKEPSDTSWRQGCELDGDGCHSFLLAPDPDQPRLVLDELSIQRDRARVEARLSWHPGCSGEPAAEASASLDGEPLDAWTGEGFELVVDELARGRHELWFRAADAAGREAEPVYVPFWIDEQDWEQGLLYYALVDRFVDGDPSSDGGEGASTELADYMGGDFQGLADALDYLEELGVTAIWITDPQDNAEGAWDGNCGTAAGYHGYWPVSPDPERVEEHLGGRDALADFVRAAHEHGMRVLMDLVVNHVHEDHPYYLEHADQGWFNEPVMCRVGDDSSNFDLIPETCWFADYLPDIRYYEAAPLQQMVEDAIAWAEAYGFDGFRVDGAKHVPHSVLWNLAARVEQEIEHRSAGGDENFYLVGETFTGDRALVASYLGEHELDGQFDFPLYYTLRSTFLEGGSSMRELEAAVAESDEAYGGAVMSPFLGNHDVSRFVTAGEEGSWADEDEAACQVADVVADAGWYDRLALAWTFLLSRPGLPLLYYGDELGLPGHGDPDNRHPFWWYSDALYGGTSGPFGLDELRDGLYHPEMARVLERVARLGRARREHPALGSPDAAETEWWIEDQLWGYARVLGDDAVLVLLNLSGEDRTLENSLSFAGLPPEGSYEDLLTGETFTASGDRIAVEVPAGDARVLLAPAPGR